MTKIGGSVFKDVIRDFPGHPVVKNLPIKEGDVGSIPGLGRFHMTQGTKSIFHNYRAHTPEPMTPN